MPTYFENSERIGGGLNTFYRNNRGEILTYRFSQGLWTGCKLVGWANDTTLAMDANNDSNIHAMAGTMAT